MRNEAILCANPLLENKKHVREIRKAISRVIDSGNYILGPEVEKFEQNLDRIQNNLDRI